MNIMNDQKQRIRQEKEAKKKTLSQILCVIDDHADDPRVMHNNTNVLTTAFIRGRHFGQSTWLSSQKLSAVSLIARVNFQYLLIWRLRNYKEMMTIFEELSALYPIDVLKEMYEVATSEPFSFWYILLTAKSKDDMFFKRFEEKMLVE